MRAVSVCACDLRARAGANESMARAYLQRPTRLRLCGAHGPDTVGRLPRPPPPLCRSLCVESGGGFFSIGTPIECLDVDVRSPGRCRLRACQCTHGVNRGRAHTHTHNRSTGGKLARTARGLATPPETGAAESLLASEATVFRGLVCMNAGRQSEVPRCLKLLEHPKPRSVCQLNPGKRNSKNAWVPRTDGPEPT